MKKHKEEHDQLEDLIEELDNDVLNDNLQNFNQRITGIRNRIRYLLQYDEQFSDVCEELLEDENDLFAREQLHHLRICSDRVERLGQHTRTLRDYSVQVRESYQAQVAYPLESHDVYIYDRYGDFPSADTDCRLVWHEFHRNAGAALEVWISLCHHSFSCFHRYLCMVYLPKIGYENKREEDFTDSVCASLWLYCIGETYEMERYV